MPVPSFGWTEDPEQASSDSVPATTRLPPIARCRRTSLRDCDLYTYDFVTGKESRLPVSRAHGALTNPTVSGDRVAYNFDPRGRDRSTKRFGVFWSRLGSKRMHRAATMPFDIGAYLPTLDLSGKRLAYSGYSALTTCLDQSQVRITRLGAKRGYGRLIARGSNRTDVFSPHWSGGFLYFGRDRFTKRSYRHDFTAHQIAKGRIERHRFRNHGNETTPYRVAAMRAVLPDRGNLLFHAAAHKGSPAAVYDAGAPGFRKIPQPR